MTKQDLTTVMLSADEGSVLIKVLENENGTYVKDNKRYNLLVSTKVAASLSDVSNWIESESLESFLSSNGFIKK